MIDDEDDDVCPLCCEELDLSDQQFYPCKCGYQVCMWCWHRIRETESGLCPACRTPYGDDPHEFSAVDMEEVVKANKEKAKAEKREKERLRAMREQEKRENLANYAPTQPSTTTNFAAALSSGGLGGTTSFGQFDGSDLISALGSGGGGGGGFGPSSHNKGPPEPPKDRSTLATMRVIRRNLVYAVGMPPNIATEENLRKPEYFGQYGKISKIVINRNHNPGDPRRASASAYVTFAHKEDTLACVLALDGFYHDGRNIRASFGTSKYCSAFIKTVRCNNPDCTYLHHMGDAEDTFNKQEIQAGYVTSGRDVAARQQQIVEQQSAAAFGTGANICKKVGGGGPSGTGKESKNPIFPPPTFDEPLPRKTKSFAQSAILQQKANIMRHGKGGLSAASIVAGGIGSGTAVPPAAGHTTLTPLKHGGSMPVAGKPIAADLTPAESMALEEQARKEALALQQKQKQMMQAQKAAKQKQQKQQAQQQQNSNSQPGSPSHTSAEPGPNGKIPAMNGVGSPHLGGGISGSNLHNMGSPLIGSSFSGNLGGSSIGGASIGSELQASTNAVPLTGFGGSGILGGQPLSLSSDDGKGGVIGGASLGGAPLGGQPSSNSFGGLGLLSANSSSGGNDKWGSAVGSSQNNDIFGGSGALWGGDAAISLPAPIGSSGGGARSIGGPGMDVGGMSLFGTNQNSYSNGAGGSTALASMLGIQLPTGSDSLRQNSSIGESSVQAPIGGLNASKNGAIGAIGSSKPNSGMMQQPIGAPQGGLGGGIPISGFSSNPGGNNDMALLQSLLPGVNITSGNEQQQHGNMQSVGVGGLNAAPQNAGQDQKQRGNIW